MRAWIALLSLAPLAAAAQEEAGARDHRVPVTAPAAAAPEPAAAPLPAQAPAAPTPAPVAPFRPEAAAFGLFVRAGADVITDRSFDLVAESDALARVEIGAELQSGLLARHLAFEVAYEGGATSAPLHDLGSTSLAVNTVHAAAVYRRNVAQLLAVTARVGLGIDVSNLTLGGDGDFGSFTGGALSGSAITAGVHGALGIEALLPFGGGDPRRRHVAVGVELGRNQRFTTARFDGVKLDASPASGSPAPVRGAPSDLGDVDLSSWTWRLGLSVRF